VQPTATNSNDTISGREQALSSYVFSHSPVIYYTGAFGEQSRLTWVSDNVESIIGYTAGEFLGATNDGRDLIHGDDFDAYREALAKLPHLGHVVHELRIMTAAGKYRWFRDERRLNETDAGDAFAGSLIDITVEKRNQSLLQDRSEDLRRFRQIVESHPMPAVCVTDAESGQFLYESPAAATMFGRRSSEQRRRKRPCCYAEPGDRAGLVADLREHGEVRDRELLLSRDDGSTFSASMCSRLITLDGREAIISGLEDLTQRRKIEQAIRGSEEFVRRLVEACPIPVGMIRLRDGKVLYTSPAGRKLFGLSSLEERSSHNFYADPADRVRIMDELHRRGEVDNAEVEYKRVDGSTFWGSVSARMVEFEGEPAVVASIFDLTERRAVEEEISRQREALYQTEKLSALGSLLASVAHELNNPLSVVVGQALLLQETAEDPSISERAVKIGRAADRCARIVKTFLGMARQQPAEAKAIRLDEVIEASLAVAGYALRSSDIQVHLRLAPDLPLISGDADQLSQVITNLIINAQHALEEVQWRRRLKISAEYREGSREVVLKVKDNGPGIPGDIRSRVFEPFFTTKDVGSGTGIGLAFCHRIIDAHGGIIEVEGDQRSGASFAIRLPAVEHVNDMAVEPPVQPTSANALHALVIDDEADVAEVLAEILTDDGHRVDVAHSGTAALQLIKHRDFDVILSDLRMPGLDGPGLYRILQSRKPRLAGRTAFITGDSLSVKSRDFLQASGRPHIEKPVTPREVRDLIERLTAHPDNGATGLNGQRPWTADRTP
jgi:PAS domain S-box-containing protein